MFCNTARASADIPPLKFYFERPKSPSSPSGSRAMSGISSAGSRCSACGFRGTPAVCPHTMSESIVARYAMHQAGVVHADVSCRRSRSKRQMPRPPVSTAYAQASVSIEPGRKTRGQTHGKNQEGRQQTAQIIGRKSSGIPHHENRTYLHYFWEFWKATLISRIYTVPSIISAIYDFKIVTPGSSCASAGPHASGKMAAAAGLLW